MAAMQAAEGLPFADVALQLGFAWAFGEALKAADPSHGHLLSAPLVLLVKGVPQLCSIAICSASELEAAFINMVSKAIVPPKRPKEVEIV